MSVEIAGQCRNGLRIAALGQPQKKAEVGAKEIYYYSDNEDDICERQGRRRGVAIRPLEPARYQCLPLSGLSGEPGKIGLGRLG
jgi:hypothetical protein